MLDCWNLQVLWMICCILLCSVESTYETLYAELAADLDWNYGCDLVLGSTLFFLIINKTNSKRGTKFLGPMGWSASFLEVRLS